MSKSGSWPFSALHDEFLAGTTAFERKTMTSVVRLDGKLSLQYASRSIPLDLGGTKLGALLGELGTPGLPASLTEHAAMLEQLADFEWSAGPKTFFFNRNHQPDEFRAPGFAMDASPKNALVATQSLTNGNVTAQFQRDNPKAPAGLIVAAHSWAGVHLVVGARTLHRASARGYRAADVGQC